MSSTTVMAKTLVKLGHDPFDSTSTPSSDNPRLTMPTKHLCQIGAGARWGDAASGTAFACDHIERAVIANI